MTDKQEEVERALPAIWVPERVVNAVLVETQAHPNTETGQAVFGVMIPGATPNNEPALIVLGTIPAIQQVIRDYGLFRDGGADQESIFKWYQSHWEALQTKCRGRVDLPHLGQPLKRGEIPQELLGLPLRYFGDWHKHPDGYSQLSGTDLNQIQELLTDKQHPMEVVLAPLVTIQHNTRLTRSWENRSLVFQQVGPEIIVAFNYRSKHLDQPVKVQPMLLPDENLPWLPPLPWHITNARRFQTEITLLKQYGCSVRWMLKEMGGDPDIQEVGIAVDHPGWHSRLLFITPWNYPDGQPSGQIFPKEQPKPVETKEPQEPKLQPTLVQAKPEKGNGHNWFTWLSEWLGNVFALAPEVTPDPLTAGNQAVVYKPQILRDPWDKSRYLVDLVRDHENRGELKKQEPKKEEAKKQEPKKDETKEEAPIVAEPKKEETK